MSQLSPSQSSDSNSNRFSNVVRITAHLFRRLWRKVGWGDVGDAGAEPAGQEVDVARLRLALEQVCVQHPTQCCRPQCD